MDKLLFKRILVTALTVLALVYVAYLLISANFDMYPTENAVQTTITEKIYTDGFVIRDEKIIKNNSSGVLSYSCADGDEVMAGGEIAKVYSNESDAVSQTISDMLQKQLEALENVQNTNRTGAIGLDVIDNNINNNLISMIEGVNNSDTNAVTDYSDALLSSINQRLLYTGKDSNFNARISELEQTIQELRKTSESIGTITTENAGYFTNYCDGYESSYNYADIKKMRLDDLRNIQKGDVPPSTAGKIVSNFNWYVACEVSPDAASNLKIWDDNVSIVFPEASTEAIPAYIYRIDQPDKDGNALAIFKCDYMNDDLIEVRQGPIEIGLGTYSGLRISKRAIHDDFVTKVTYDENDNAHKEEKKVQGVYVLYGSEVQFKQISILYSDRDTVLCDPSPERGVLFNGETVSLYDKVIIKGDDLYDGKVIS
ncbi:MAG: HlyD family efflux transporter periplasmic adaptor subunit [Ruminococcus sp.]|nr:HlyD family efflux transporter periplasmic adaptor subunit [Ruminococcus sp.]